PLRTPLCVERHYVRPSLPCRAYGRNTARRTTPWRPSGGVRTWRGRSSTPGTRRGWPTRGVRPTPTSSPPPPPASERGRSGGGSERADERGGAGRGHHPRDQEALPERLGVQGARLTGADGGGT